MSDPYHRDINPHLDLGLDHHPYWPDKDLYSLPLTYTEHDGENLDELLRGYWADGSPLTRRLLSLCCMLMNGLEAYNAAAKDADEAWSKASQYESERDEALEDLSGVKQDRDELQELVDDAGRDALADNKRLRKVNTTMHSKITSLELQVQEMEAEVRDAIKKRDLALRRSAALKEYNKDLLREQEVLRGPFSGGRVRPKRVIEIGGK